MKNNLNKNKRNTITGASVLTMVALVFASYSAAAMSSSFNISPLQNAYGQEEQQDQSAVMDKAIKSPWIFSQSSVL